MPKTELEKYKEYVTARLSQLSPIFQKYAIGDFSGSIEIPKEEDEFTELFIGLDLTMNDLREIIKAEVEARAYIKNIINNMTESLIVIKQDTTIHLVNKTTCDLLEYKEEELIGKPVAIIFAEEVTPFKGTRMKKLIEEGSIRDNGMTYKTKAGEKIPVSFSGSVMKNKEGELVVIVGIARDMREIKRFMQKEKELAAQAQAAADAEKKKTAELARLNKELQDKEVLIDGLMDNITDSIYFKDRDSRFVLINKAEAEKFCIKDPEEAVGKTDFDFFSKEHASQAFEDEQKIIKTGKPIIGIEEKETFEDGEDRWITTTKMPLYNKGKNIIGTFGISRDITEKKEASENLKKAHQELKEATAQLVHTERMSAMGELTAGVAHELNQPLNNIKIVCQGILRDIDKNRLDINTVPQDLKDVVGQVNKMAEIINHMRIFTRRIGGEGREEININEPVNNMFMLLGEQLRVHNIDVIKNLAPNLPKILGYSVGLEQVFTNIIVNARSAMENFREKGRRIEIKTFMMSEKEVAVSIKDNGGGMPPDIRDRIFEPFFTTKPPGQGTGLGLSITKKLVEDHNGRIELEVKEGEGSTFTVVIPIVNEKKGVN